MIELTKPKFHSRNLLGKWFVAVCTTSLLSRLYVRLKTSEIFFCQKFKLLSVKETTRPFLLNFLKKEGLILNYHLKDETTMTCAYSARLLLSNSLYYFKSTLIRGSSLQWFDFVWQCLGLNRLLRIILMYDVVWTFLK